MTIVRIAKAIEEAGGIMGNLSQAKCTASLKTPLGDDVLVLKSFAAAEGLSEPFEFQVDALSETENMSFDGVLGRPCTIKLKTYKQKERLFCGIAVEARWTGKDEGVYFAYTLTLRPWFWLLGHRANCRIFLDKDVKEIIQKVFEDANFSSGKDFRLPSGDYDKIDYCVQYRETDFAFVSRLMEQYGIYYFFEHQDGQHTMVLADSKSSHAKIADLDKLRLLSTPASGSLPDEQHLYGWRSDRCFRTGKITFKDYDYCKPPKDLLADKEGTENYQYAKFEVYDYPGKYDDKGKGEKFAQFRLDAEQAMDHRRTARGAAPSLRPGGLVTIDEPTTSAQSTDYLVIRANHSFGTQYYVSAPSGASEHYYGIYEFLPRDQQFRTLPLTPKPRIYGIHTAKVVGKHGEEDEEISTDDYGRIWVQFHWDREPQKSCPIRVAQVWASNKWGGLFIPRIGMEVVVDFLEGDPDRPLVVGCVYNGDNKSPYDLPDNKTQSGLKSDSSKGHSGYNEFMFEDKQGSEKIRMHGEKDHEVVIKNSESWTIGEVFPSPQGSPSRQAELKNGDDNLTLDMGHHNVTLKMGNQVVTLQMGNQNTTLQVGNQQVDLVAGQHTTNAMTGITHAVAMGVSSVSIQPASISHESPTMNATAMEINQTAAVINITGVVNITGMVNIVGGLTVDGMVPMLLPA